MNRCIIEMCYAKEKEKSNTLQTKVVFINDSNHGVFKARKRIVKQFCLHVAHKMSTKMRKVWRWVKKADEDEFLCLSIADVKTGPRQLVLSRTVKSGILIYNCFDLPRARPKITYATDQNDVSSGDTNVVRSAIRNECTWEEAIYWFQNIGEDDAIYYIV